LKYSGDLIYKSDNIKLYNWYSFYSNLIIKDFRYIFKVIKNSSVYIPYIILTITICIILYITIIVCLDLFNLYTHNLLEFRDNKLKFILEHRFTSNNNQLSNYKLPDIINKIGKFCANNTLSKLEWQFKYTNFYSNISDILNINSILSKVNLDFCSMVNNSVCIGASQEVAATNNIVLDNSLVTSSSIINQANFNSLSVSINPNISFDTIYQDISQNPLGIYSNRNSLRLVTDDLAIVKSKELLNYQSNILYCIINGLSPSLY